jgi:hypothetical protein
MGQNPTGNGQDVEAKVNAMNRRAMAAMLGLVVMLHSAGCLALDDADNAIVTALEYTMGDFRSRETRQQRPAPSFCLMRGRIKREMSLLEEPIGNGVSKDVVSALRARGYNVFSSDDVCTRVKTYECGGHLRQQRCLG